MANQAEPGLTYVTPVDAIEAEFVRRLARHLVRDQDARVTLLGEGFNNWVYRLQRPQGDLALKLGKPHRRAFVADEHRKEMWCAAVARAVGVPTPEIPSVGLFEGRPYQLQAYAPGRSPEPHERPRIWGALGEWARKIHGIPVSGWGNRFVGDGVFDGDWSEHLAYNIGALTLSDPLLGLGVIDERASDDLKRRFGRLAATSFRIGLCHADLAAHNVLVNDQDDGRLSLIDWGCAFAGPVPHYEINEMIRSERASREELDIFRRAYGLGDAEYAAVQADLPDLLALREIDTLRWGLEHRKDEIKPLARRAKRALARLRP